MILICDSTVGEGESVTPNTKFRKSWHVQNSGTEAWPDGICLQHTGGEQMGECTRVPVPSLGPKETTEVSVVLTSPPDVGLYQSKWRMMTSTGSYFGGELNSLNELYHSMTNFVAYDNNLFFSFRRHLGIV